MTSTSPDQLVTLPSRAASANHMPPRRHCDFESVGEVTERVVRHRADIRPLRFVG
ncbi:hypothetical protein [Streptomyces cellostaticus]|uniref:hypothetical protein n=1 Tax=Streptomyces cellostaticus TaxID=67285 RepID=UPI000ABE0FDE|nr:hypothetical protein [Streptomyces cellostaticus]GHI10132.1 hypothetical protein Scel_84530 [Streptomyces cellostaticus]